MTRIAIVGDALLDRDILGVIDRLCPDAPAPVVDQREAIERPGGAALTAVLAARTGVHVSLLAPISGDAAGIRLLGLLRAEGVDVAEWPDPAATIEKERVWVRERPIVRVDRGGGSRSLPDPPSDSIRQLLTADAVLVSDYGRGATAGVAVRDFIAACIQQATPVVWDPHRSGSIPVPGVTLATPNTSELRSFDPRSGGADQGSGLASIIGSAQRLLHQWRARGISVTRGAEGAALVSRGSLPLVVPVDAPEPNPIDTCGAGDAFAVHCVLAFAAGAVMSEVVQTAVLQAARYVTEGGALGLAQPARGSTPIARPVAADRSTTLVATGGCFDLLHAGHVAMLQGARQLGDRLVVLLNSDDSVRRLKGRGRPLQRQADRAALLRSLGCVDDVIVFHEDTPIEALRSLRPDVFVKGGDYSSTTLPETTVLHEWGGVVITVPYLPGRSTSSIVEQIEATHVG